MEYENEGATAWDRTVNVRKRPDWLRAAATLKAVDVPKGAENDEYDEDDDIEVEVDFNAFALPMTSNPTVWEARGFALACARKLNRVNSFASTG